MTNKACLPISKRIGRIYYIGGLALLVLYSLVFNTIVTLTENLTSERRLEIVAPYHFQHFERGEQGKIKISPLIHIYDDISLLPALVQRRIGNSFQGVDSFQLEPESGQTAHQDVLEYVIYAAPVDTPTGTRVVYAIETPDAVEWDDVDFFVVEVAIFILGFAVLLIIAGFIVRALTKISEPFVELAHRLDNNAEHDFHPIEIDAMTSQEFEQTQTALNNYRERISELIAREKSFTRYISHELRTPMTVVKGALSILRKQNNEQSLKQAERIHQAVEQMENLTHTFLLLARNEQNQHVSVTIDERFIEQLNADLNSKAQANQTELKITLLESVELQAEPLLLYSVAHNILLNAINSTIQGRVEAKFSSEGIEVLDNGVGLSEKARGYEGFGVGLLLVQDICQKYHWSFKLEDNQQGKGCVAQVLFNIAA